MLLGQSINSNSTNDLKMSNWDAKIQLGIEPQYFHCLLTKSGDCAWGRVGKNGLDWGCAEVGKRAKRCKKRPRKMHIWWWLNRHHSIQNSSRCPQSYFQRVIRPQLGNVGLWGFCSPTFVTQAIVKVCTTIQYGAKLTEEGVELIIFQAALQLILFALNKV